MMSDHGNGGKVWVVTFSCDEGADVWLYVDVNDAAAKYDELCREWDVNPGLGYAAEGATYEHEPDKDDPYGWSALWGDKAVEIGGPRLVEIR